jgi:hypothetical protein
MHSLLNRDPLRPIASKIALVHRERNWRQVDLADEAGHARDLDCIWMAEELATCDKPAKLVAAQS